jgi:alkanesulfonate monooxygenase SsuD/methylene tetrahydromethanopterin reductase-like flavin-dependent oxidoreductase (luciferase family)
VQEPLPVWVGVGGTPESAVRAGMLGLPMALGIIGGLPERFVPFAGLHRRAAEEAGHGRPELGINAHGFLASSSQEAADLAYGPFAETMNRIGRERGWPPTTREDFDTQRTLRGALFLGSPQEVTEKILFQQELFGHDRFLIQLTVGPMPHDRLLRAIELFGTEVAPAVRRAVA